MSARNQPAEALLSPYITQIAALAAKAEAGEDVTGEIEKVIGTALRHIGAINTDAKLANLLWLAAELKTRRDILRQSLNAYGVFQDAFCLVSGCIDSLRIE